MKLVKRIDIGQCHPKISLDLLTPGNWRTHNFHIAPGRPGKGKFLDSCVSPPSRYLFEMYRRIAELEQNQDGWVFLFNPLLLLGKDETLLVLASLRGIEARNEWQVAVLYDNNNLPVAYLLPRSLIDDPRFLVLLSCSDSMLDAVALETLYSCDVTRNHLDVWFSPTTFNGFYAGKYLLPNEVCCRHASALLKARWVETGSQNAPTRRACRDSIPIYAFVSHHAGDVLFASLAARLSPSIFQGLVIHRDYAPICHKAGLPLAMLEFAGPVAHRGGYQGEDSEHFIEILPALPADRFYFYARTSRDYNNTDHHLIDHYSFLLGAPMATAAELDGGRPLPSSPKARACIPNSSSSERQVLLHFDAGWPLKIYPPEWQQDLVGMLLEQGYSVTVLDAATEIQGCRRARFGSLQEFDRLLNEHDLLIGMDSFPAHYASLIWHIPTLCLFSSTHPVHSRTRPSPDYLWMSEELNCAPCRAYGVCPRFGGDRCRNFPPPKKVCVQAAQLLSASSATSVGHSISGEVEHKSGSSSNEFRHLPSVQLPQRQRAGPRIPVTLDPGRLEYGRLYRTYRAKRHLRSLLGGTSLIGEYIVAVRDLGFWRANLLAREYLLRKLTGAGKPNDQ